MGDQLKTYDINQPWKTLDPWQKDYIAEKGNCFLLCGRQSGKTTAASIKFAERAIKNPNHIVLMIAFTEKQAYILFFKTLMYIRMIHPKMLTFIDKKGKKRLLKQTQHEINLRNGSKIMCYAAGLEGLGLAGFTVHSLVVDEAAPMAREVFIKTTPMLSVTGGTLDLLSTPRGKVGYFYECSDDPALGDKILKDIRRFYVSAENCPRHAKKFLDNEKLRMSELEYAQEYLARFLDDLKRRYPAELLKKCCILKRPEVIERKYNHYLGVDIARMGEDKGAYEIIKKIGRNLFHQVENVITKKQLTTETERAIINMHAIWNFKEIGIDAGAGTLGVSVLDHLREVLPKRKITAMNSRQLVQDKDEKSRIRILNEDMYNNLAAMMERGELLLLDDDEVIASLASIQYEYIIKYGQPTKLRIFSVPHNASDVAEGLIRAAWAAAKDESLNTWVDYI